ncbi:MAG: 30S ribosomal protein S20 [Patescibacteria group bacterium]
MPNTRSAKKALRQSKSRRVFNLRRSRAMKDVVKDIHRHVRAHDITEAQKLLPQAYQAIDKAAKRGIISKNTASRRKASIARQTAKKS